MIEMIPVPEVVPVVLECHCGAGGAAGRAGRAEGREQGLSD